MLLLYSAFHFSSAYFLLFYDFVFENFVANFGKYLVADVDGIYETQFGPVAFVALATLLVPV
jgi:hypothetical protein